MTELDETFAPVTSKIGFLEAPFERVVEELVSWRQELYGEVAVLEVGGGLRDGVEALLPLTWGFGPRELVIATQNRAWTALLSSRFPASDPISPPRVLARRLSANGAAVIAIPDVRPTSDRTERQGSRQLHVFPASDLPSEVWSVAVTSDGGRWRFDRIGPAQPFENEDAYRRRPVADRLTLDMLVEYTAALGLRPFDHSFFSGPSVLVSSPQPGPQNPKTLTLDEAQVVLGIRDQ